MSTSYDISAILDRLPEFTRIFERDGHKPQRIGTAWFALCPFHDEESPSCQINNERRRFHCFGCGASGDPFDYWQKRHGKSFKDALADLAGMASVGPARELPTHDHTPKPKPVEKPIQPLDSAALAKWTDAIHALASSPREIGRIATWRGIEPAAVEFATNRGLMGLYPYYGQRREAFLVEMPGPTDMIPVSVHVRLAPGTSGNGNATKASWRYDPPDCGAWPWIIGDVSKAIHIFLVEGQWDALALVSIMGWHHSFPENVAVVALRGATSGRKFLRYGINPDAWIFAFADADKAGATWFDPNGGLLAELTDKLKRPSQLQGFMPSTDGADLNDLVKAGEIDRDTILGLILPYLPNKHTAPYPTFLQWCRRHRGDDPPLGPAAAHILADPERLRGRRPLAAWEAHWKRSKTPPEMLEHLHAAWSAYQADFRP